MADLSGGIIGPNIIPGGGGGGVGGGGPTGDYTIPNGLNEIDSETFRNATGLTSITIPDSVWYIRSNAFQGCTALTTVTFTGIAQISDIEDNVFYGCSSLTRINFTGKNLNNVGNASFYGCSSLLEVIAPDQVRTIGTDCYNGCTSLTSIIFGYMMSILGTRAFYGCTNLASIEFLSQYNLSANPQAFFNCPLLVNNTFPVGNNIFGVSPSGDYVITGTSIDPLLFQNAKGLTRVTIPATVTAIPADAFFGCSSLAEVIFTGTSQLRTIGNNAFNTCTALSTISIPSSVISIGNNAFYDCIALTTVLFTGTSQLQTIGENVFYSCLALSIINIPNSVKSIGTQAFIGCSSLTTVGINSDTSSLEVLGANAFYNCSGLQTLTIPASLTSIGVGAFSGCNSITTLTINSNLFTPDIFYSRVLTTVTIGKSITDCSNNLFTGQSSLTSVTFAAPSSVEIIGEGAFQYCVALKAISLPSSVTTIGLNAFSGCTSLESIAISSAVTYIGETAFSLCTSLKSFRLPESVQFVGDAPFAGCSALASLTVNVPILTANLFLEIAPSTIVIGTGVRDISGSPFQSEIAMLALTSLSFDSPSSVLRIGQDAFGGCRNLTNALHIPASVQVIEENAFAHCSLIPSISFDAPSTLKRIDDLAFFGCTSITTFSIPDSVTSFGSQVLINCPALTTLIIGNGLTDISNIRIPNIQSISLGSSIITIPSNFCYGNTSLTSVIFAPQSAVTDISGVAFYGCTALTAIALPASLTRLGQLAFAGCSSLVSLSFPPNSSLRRIDDAAFQACTSLASFMIPHSVTSLGIGIFSACSGLTNLVIGDGLTVIPLDLLNSSSLQSLTIGSSIVSYFDHNATIVTKFNGITTTTYGPVTSPGLPTIIAPALTDLYFAIPSSITSIKANQFQACTSLKKLVLPSSITDFDPNAFGLINGPTKYSSWLPAGNNYINGIKQGVTIAGYNIWTIELSGTTLVAMDTSTPSVAIPGLTVQGLDFRGSPTSSLRVSNMRINGIDISGGLVTQTITPPPPITNLVVTNYALSQEMIRNYSSPTIYSPLAGITIHTPVIQQYVVRDPNPPYRTTSMNPALSGFRYSVKLGDRAPPDFTTNWIFTGPLDLSQIGDTVTAMIESFATSSLIQFAYPRNLTAINPLGNPRQITKLILPPALASTFVYGTNGFSSLQSVTLPTTLTEILPNMFAGTGISSIDIPPSVTKINIGAFSGCTSLVSLVIPAGVTYIPRSMCEGCTSLVSVTFLGPVATIDALAFKNCTSLIRVILTSVSSIKNLSLPTAVIPDPRRFGDNSEYYNPFYNTPFATDLFSGAYLPQNIRFGTTADAGKTVVLWDAPVVLHPWLSQYSIYVNTTRYNVSPAAVSVMVDTPTFGANYVISATCSYLNNLFNNSTFTTPVIYSPRADPVWWSYFETNHVAVRPFLPQSLQSSVDSYYRLKGQLEALPYKTIIINTLPSILNVDAVAPAGLEIYPGWNEVKIMWQPPSNNSTGITYTIHLNNSSSTQTVTTYFDNNLQLGASYTVRISSNSVLGIPIADTVGSFSITSSLPRWWANRVAYLNALPHSADTAAMTPSARLIKYAEPVYPGATLQDCAAYYEAHLPGTNYDNYFTLAWVYNDMLNATQNPSAAYNQAISGVIRTLSLARGCIKALAAPYGGILPSNYFAADARGNFIRDLSSNLTVISSSLANKTASERLIYYKENSNLTGTLQQYADYYSSRLPGIKYVNYIISAWIYYDMYLTVTEPTAATAVYNNLRKIVPWALLYAKNNATMEIKTVPVNYFAADVSNNWFTDLEQNMNMLPNAAQLAQISAASRLNYYSRPIDQVSPTLQDCVDYYLGNLPGLDYKNYYTLVWVYYDILKGATLGSSNYTTAFNGLRTYLPQAIEYANYVNFPTVDYIPSNYFTPSLDGSIFFPSSVNLTFTTPLRRIDLNAFESVQKVSFTGKSTYDIFDGNIHIAVTTEMPIINITGNDILLPGYPPYIPANKQLVVPPLVAYIPERYFMDSSATSIFFSALSPTQSITIGAFAFPLNSIIHYIGNSKSYSQKQFDMDQFYLSLGSTIKIDPMIYDELVMTQRLGVYGGFFYHNFPPNISPQDLWDCKVSLTKDQSSDLKRSLIGNTKDYKTFYSWRYPQLLWAPTNIKGTVNIPPNTSLENTVNPAVNTYIVATSKDPWFVPIMLPHTLSRQITTILFGGLNHIIPTAEDQMRGNGQRYVLNEFCDGNRYHIKGQNDGLKLLPTDMRFLGNFMLTLPDFIRNFNKSTTPVQVPNSITIPDISGYKFMFINIPNAPQYQSTIINDDDLPTAPNSLYNTPLDGGIVYYGNLQWFKSRDQNGPVLQAIGLNTYDPNITINPGMLINNPSYPSSMPIFGTIPVNSLTIVNEKAPLLPRGMFKNNTTLTAVRGQYAGTSLDTFYGCSSLSTPIDLNDPSGSIVLGAQSFAECVLLPWLRLITQKGRINIGDYLSKLSTIVGVFDNCRSLSSVDLAATGGSIVITDNAFTRMSKLSIINLTAIPYINKLSGLDTWPSITVDNNAFSNPNADISGVDLTLRSAGDIFLSPGSFANCTSVLIITEGAVNIRNEAFKRVTKLTIINQARIPTDWSLDLTNLNLLTVLEIRSNGNCTLLNLPKSLISVIIDCPVVFLPTKAFDQSSMLKTVSISTVSLSPGQTSLETIFSGCSSLQSITLGCGPVLDENKNLRPTVVGILGNELNNNGLKQVSIIGGSWTIPATIFQNCSSLTSVIMNITNSVSNTSFIGCPNLSTLILTFSLDVTHTNALLAYIAASTTLSDTTIAFNNAEQEYKTNNTYTGWLDFVNARAAKNVAQSNINEAFLNYKAVLDNITANSPTVAYDNALKQYIAANINNAIYIDYLATFTEARNSISVADYTTTEEYNTAIRDADVLVNEARTNQSESQSGFNTAAGVVAAAANTHYTFNAPLSEMPRLTNLSITGNVNVTSPSLLSNSSKSSLRVHINQGILTNNYTVPQSCSSSVLYLKGVVTLPPNFSTTNFPNLTMITIHFSTPGVLPPYLFANNTNITKITLINVSEIGEGAFFGCKNLTYLNILDNTRSGEGLTAIGNYAFANSGLTGVVTIPSTVTTFGIDYFVGCPAITGITYLGSVLRFEDPTRITNSIWDELINIPNPIFQIKGSTVITQATTATTPLVNYVIPSTVLSGATFSSYINKNIFKNRYLALDSLLASLMSIYADITLVQNYPENLYATISPNVLKLYTPNTNPFRNMGIYQNVKGPTDEDECHTIFLKIINLAKSYSDKVVQSRYKIDNLDTLFGYDGLSFPALTAALSGQGSQIWQSAQAADNDMGEKCAAAAQRGWTGPTKPGFPAFPDFKLNEAVNAYRALAYANSNLYSPEGGGEMFQIPIDVTITEPFSLSVPRDAISQIDGVSNVDISNNQFQVNGNKLQIVWQTNELDDNQPIIFELTDDSTISISGMMVFDVAQNVDVNTAATYTWLYNNLAAFNAPNSVNFTFSGPTTVIHFLDHKKGGRVIIDSALVMLDEFAMTNLVDTTLSITGESVYIYNNAFNNWNNSTLNLTIKDVEGSGVYPGKDIFLGSEKILVNSNAFLIHHPIIAVVNINNESVTNVPNVIETYLNSIGSPYHSTDTFNTYLSTYIPENKVGFTQAFPMITFQIIDTLQEYVLLGKPEDWFWATRGKIPQPGDYYYGKASLPAPNGTTSGDIVNRSFPMQLNFVFPDVNDPVAKNTGLSSAFAPETLSYAGTIFKRTDSGITTVQAVEIGLQSYRETAIDDIKDESGAADFWSMFAVMAANILIAVVSIAAAPLTGGVSIALLFAVAVATPFIDRAIKAGVIGKPFTLGPTTALIIDVTIASVFGLIGLAPAFKAGFISLKAICTGSAATSRTVLGTAKVTAGTLKAASKTQASFAEITSASAFRNPVRNSKTLTSVSDITSNSNTNLVYEITSQGQSVSFAPKIPIPHMERTFLPKFSSSSIKNVNYTPPVQKIAAVQSPQKMGDKLATWAERTQFHKKRNLNEFKVFNRVNADSITVLFNPTVNQWPTGTVKLFQNGFLPKAAGLNIGKNIGTQGLGRQKMIRVSEGKIQGIIKKITNSLDPPIMPFTRLQPLAQPSNVFGRALIQRIVHKFFRTINDDSSVPEETNAILTNLTKDQPELGSIGAVTLAQYAAYTCMSEQFGLAGVGVATQQAVVKTPLIRAYMDAVNVKNPPYLFPTSDAPTVPNRERDGVKNYQFQLYVNQGTQYNHDNLERASVGWPCGVMKTANPLHQIDSYFWDKLYLYAPTSPSNAWVNHPDELRNTRPIICASKDVQNELYLGHRYDITYNLLESGTPNSVYSGTSDLALVIREGVTSIPSHAFSCSNGKDGSLPYTKLKLYFPSSIRNIGMYAFYNSPIEVVNLPSQATIAIRAFANSGIKGVTFGPVPIAPNILQPRDIIQGPTIGAGAFAGCTNLQNVTLAEGTISIGDNAFADTPNLAHIHIPEGVTTIGNGVFQGSSATQVTFPSSVTSVGTNLFGDDSPPIDIVVSTDPSGNEAFLAFIAQAPLGSTVWVPPSLANNATLAELTNIQIRIDVPPNQVTNVTAIIGPQSIQIFWDPTDSSGSVVKSYILDVSGNTVFSESIGAAAQPSYTISADKLQNRSAYTFSIYAVNANGLDGPASIPITVTPLPDPPTVFTNLLTDTDGGPFYANYSFTMPPDETKALVWAQTDASANITSSLCRLFSQYSNVNLLRRVNCNVSNTATLNDARGTIIFDSNLKQSTYTPEVSIRNLSGDTQYIITAATTNSREDQLLAFALQTYAGSEIPLTLMKTGRRLNPAGLIALNDSSLRAFTINGVDVLDKSGETGIILRNSTSATIVATPTDPYATVDVSGETNFTNGVNNITVSVISSDTLSTSLRIVSIRTVLDTVSQTTLNNIAADPVIVTTVAASAVADIDAANTVASKQQVLDALISSFATANTPADTQVSILVSTAFDLPPDANSNSLTSSLNDSLTTIGLLPNVPYDLCSNIITDLLSSIPPTFLDATYSPASLAAIIPDPSTKSLIVDFRRSDMALLIVPGVTYTVTAIDPSGSPSTDSHSVVYTRTPTTRYVTVDGIIQRLDGYMSFRFGENIYYIEWKGFGKPMGRGGSGNRNPICFLSNAPVLTPSGYQRIDTLKAGDPVKTADGRTVTIEKVVRRVAAPGPNSNPYIIPIGLYGATTALAVSPNHRVAVPGRGLQEAKNLGLKQMPMRTAWSYYNLVLPCWATDNLIVAGVETESLAPTTCIRMAMADFTEELKHTQKHSLQDIIRQCRFHEDGTVTVPVER